MPWLGSYSHCCPSFQLQQAPRLIVPGTVYFQPVERILTGSILFIFYLFLTSLFSPASTALTLQHRVWGCTQCWAKSDTAKSLKAIEYGMDSVSGFVMCVAHPVDDSGLAGGNAIAKQWQEPNYFTFNLFPFSFDYFGFGSLRSRFLKKAFITLYSTTFSLFFAMLILDVFWLVGLWCHYDIMLHRLQWATPAYTVYVGVIYMLVVNVLFWESDLVTLWGSKTFVSYFLCDAAFKISTFIWVLVPSHFVHLVLELHHP